MSLIKTVKFFVLLLVIPLSACGSSLQADHPIAFLAPPAIAWQTYQSPLYNFSFQYPPDAVKLDRGSDTNFTISLPILPSSSLVGKYLYVVVTTNKSSCPSIYGGLEFVKTIGVNDISFLYESGKYSTGRSLSDWVSYSTARHHICVNLTLVLLPGEAGNYINTVNGFDRSREIKVFQRILLTFGWTKP
jgi:hypothetical protein